MTTAAAEAEQHKQQAQQALDTAKTRLAEAESAAAKADSDESKQAAAVQVEAIKKEVADVVVSAITPFRERTLELMQDPAQLDKILADGAERAAEVAEATVRRVYDRVGLLLGTARA